MSEQKTTNMIIKLKEKGWNAEEIISFLVYIGTHDPTEYEVNIVLGR